MPTVREVGHLFLEWDFSAINFTTLELEMFQLPLFHNSSTKLFNLINSMHPDQANCVCPKTLDDISQACETCHRRLQKPASFQARISTVPIFSSVVDLNP